MRRQPDVTAGAFAAALRPFRRRLRLSVFARTLAVTGAVSFALLTVVVLTVPPLRTAAVAAWSGALAAAVAAAWMVALVRTPSLAATAATLDRELRLHDGCVTALQFSASSDAMSSLVVQDALARLHGVPPARLPLRVRPAPYWLMTALAAVAALASVAGTMAEREAMAGDAREAPAGADAATGLRGGDSRRAADDRAAAAATDAVARESRPDHREVAAARPARTLRDLQTRSSRATERTAKDVPSESADGAGVTDDAPDAGSGGPRTGDAARAPAVSPDRGERNGATNGGDRAALTNGDFAGAGRGGGGRGSARPGPGGVAGGAVLSSAARTSVVDAEAPDLADRASYRAAYARAEAALAREPVPAPLRDYVREYFRAIRPEAER
jgi:hypothetical protein